MKVHNNTHSYKSIKNYVDVHSGFTSTALIQEFGAQMNRSTIYRILSRLSEKGYIHSFTDDKGIVWYAKCKKCTAKKHFDFHAHFKCMHCGIVECIDDIEIELNLPKSYKHTFSSQEIFLKGKCESCTQNEIQST